MLIKRKATLLCTIVSVALFTSTVYARGPAHVSGSDVYWWWGEHSGSSKIVRTNKGISGNWTSSMSNAIAGAEGLAVTLWIIVFNYPGECATVPCSEAGSSPT